MESSDPREGVDPASPGADRGWSRAVPVATFIVGLLLGGLVVSIATGSDDGRDPTSDTAAGESAAGDTGSGGGADTDITIPAACSEAADDATRVIELVRTAVGAVRDFDPDTVDKSLDELESLDPQLRAKAQQCTAVRVAPTSTATPSEVAVPTQVPTTTLTETPATTDTATGATASSPANPTESGSPAR